MRWKFFVVVLFFLVVSCIRISYNFFVSAVPTTVAESGVTAQGDTKRRTFNLKNSIFASSQTTFTIPHKTREFDLHLSKVDLSPDGYQRKIWSMNGSYPGPTIEVNKGDRVLIHVHNNLEEPTSIHVHGLYQRGTPWMDGVPFQTQCPIPNNDTFTYDFSVPDQSGTYWYHSHYISQYVDGMVAAFIIHDPEDPYLNDYDEELIVMITDWYHEESAILLKRYLSPDSQGDEPVPNNGLINGKNNYNCEWASDKSNCFENAGHSKFTFETNKRYRIRIINTSGFSAFTFSIDNHEMEIIEVDGSLTQKHKINRLPIHVGQRYSVLVTAIASPESNYWMRAKFHKDCLPENTKHLTSTVKAMIHYKDSLTQQPDSEPVSSNSWEDNVDGCVDLDAKLLKPYYLEKIPDATRKIVLKIEFKEDENGVERAFVNGSSYVPNMRVNNTLQNVISGNHEFGRNQNVFIYNNTQEVVDLAFINTDDGEHPFHLHGHKFWVLGWGNETMFPDYSKLNTIDAIQRDTSTIPPNGWTVIRFKPNNPGWHVEAGLLVQFVELPEEIKKLNPPSEWYDLCEVKKMTII
ncbi:4203_t:CDS:2 [Funneliformis caledonium]|uniref:4203_t:CDS:1 n=1 Tax=Funneliformis caledonium TaxID=1117310 RepID=A0A9N8V3F9_9GLOM|nr:4203_t:CDS:2 [Funneliformis caledonium]